MENVALTTNKNYTEQLQIFNGNLSILNIKFLHMLENLKIQKVDFVALGNSISAGFSMCDMIIPFAMRNTELYNERKNNNMGFYSFARIILNSENNIINWYTDNMKHEAANKLVIDDTILHKEQCNKEYWNNDVFERYIRLGKQSNIGLKDLNENNNSSKIMIYNGYTGTLMDSLFRGNIKDKLKIVTCFKKDLNDLKTLLSLIYSGNNSTQVYICGLPNIFGMNITGIFDYEIKKVCSNYPNTVFVNGAKRNILFSNNEGCGKGDVHYSQPEYLELHNNIMNEINTNYLSTKFITNIESKIKKQSQMVELNDRTAKNDTSAINKIINESVEEYAHLFEYYDHSLKESLARLQRHYSDNHLEQYYFTNKEKTLKLIEKHKSK